MNREAQNWVDIEMTKIAVGILLVLAFALLARCVLGVLVIAPVTHASLYWSVSLGLVYDMMRNVIICPYDHMGNYAIRLYNQIRTSARNSLPGEITARYESSRKSHRIDKYFGTEVPMTRTHSDTDHGRPWPILVDHGRRIRLCRRSPPPLGQHA